MPIEFDENGKFKNMAGVCLAKDFKRDQQ